MRGSAPFVAATERFGEETDAAARFAVAIEIR
jgi:hypothetical protein